MQSAVPPPRFSSLDRGFADTPARSDLEATTRRSTAAPSPKPASTVAAGMVVSRLASIRHWLRPGLITRLRILACTWLDPRDWEEKRAERLLMEACIAEYRGEIAWHMHGGQRSLFGAWKDAQIARWTRTAALVRAREKGMRR